MLYLLDASIGPGGDAIQYAVAFTNATTGDPNAIIPASNIVTGNYICPHHLSYNKITI